MRTKLGVIDEILNPVSNWREIIKRALPYAEKYNVVMQPELHAPTRLTDPMVQEYAEFIDKENTKYFGFNVDFGVFKRHDPNGIEKMHLASRRVPASRRTSFPICLHPLLPREVLQHERGLRGDNNSYREVIDIMIKHGWDGYLLASTRVRTIMTSTTVSRRCAVISCS